MKVTSINARMDSAGVHNDRNFDVSLANHIDNELSSGNKYYTYNGDYEHSFREVEVGLYQDLFSDHVSAQNEKNAINRHENRNQTIEQYYKNKWTRPEDKILQIGDKDHHATPEQLWECALEYKDRFNEIYGDNCKIIDMALHVDEATPHVHIRRVWVAHDDNGDLFVSQNKALEALGVLAPDPSQPSSRWNNSKVTFTHMDRALFEDICIEKGLVIDQNHEKGEHLTTNQFKEKQAEEHLRELEHKSQNIKEELDSIDSIIQKGEEFFSQPYFEDRYIDEIEENKKKKREDRLKALTSIYNKEIKNSLEKAEDFQKAAIRSQIDTEIRSMESFLEDHGLLNEYREQQEYEKRQKRKEKEEKKKDEKIFF